MGFFDFFPYTNFHNVNLDWVLQRVKEWGELVQANDVAFHNLEEANASFKQYVETYLQNLDVQDEINIKMDSLLESGVLTEYLQPYVSEDVSAWLDEHITEPEGVVIDTSLTVSGACADAKAVGDKIAETAEQKVDIQQSVGDFGKVLIINREGMVQPGIASGNGLTDSVKIALLACFKHVHGDEESENCYNALVAALNSGNSLLSAVINYGDSTIFTDDPFSKIKWMLKVYYNGTEISTQNYTLTGNLVEGQNVLTITYNDESTSIIVEASPAPLSRLVLTAGDLLKFNGESLSLSSDNHIPPYLVSTESGRVYYTSKGHTPYRNENNDIVAGTYPIPIPAYASHVRVAVAPNTYKIAINCWYYSNSEKRYLYINNTDTGFNTHSSETDIQQYPSNARALSMIIKKADGTNINQLEEPTQVVVQFT